MSNTFLIGTSGSGKTIYIKKRILENLKTGKPSIFINFRKGSDDFSDEILNTALIVNSNSFTQISKIKDKSYEDLIVFNFSNQSNTLSKTIKEKVLFEIMNNENWENHDIFIDEAYFITNYDQIKNINRKGNTFYSIMSIRDFKPSNFEDIVYFITGRMYENTSKDIQKYLNKKEENIIKYVEKVKGQLTFGSVDLNKYQDLDDSLSYIDRMEIILS